MILKTCHHQLIHLNFNLNQVQWDGEPEVSHVILVPHAVQRRELFTTVMPTKWRRLVYRHFHHHWTEWSWRLLHLFSPRWMPGDICGSGVITLRTSVFSEFLGTALHLPHLSSLYVHSLMGCNWPLFLVICQLCVTVSHRNIVRIRSSIIQYYYLMSVILSCHHLQRLWKFVTL